MAKAKRGRGRPRLFADKDAKRIRKRRRDGDSVADIAADLDVSAQTVYNYLKRA
jgi:hypothetical protein